MIAAPRQSILSRPIRKNAPLRNTENIDVEYEHSQARLHAKQQRYQEQEDYRRRCLEGTREEKVHLQEERRQEMQVRACGPLGSPTWGLGPPIRDRDSVVCPVPPPPPQCKDARSPMTPHLVDH